MAAYLKYKALEDKGESAAKGHEKWIEIGSVQLGVGRGIRTPVGSSAKREASAPNVSEVMITKLMDSTSPLLFQEALIGKASEAKIDLVETGHDQLNPYLEITLTNAMISGYSVSSGGDRPSESISLNFTKIEYKYTQYKNDGTKGVTPGTTYDLTVATNK
jgi:type VI secretion system secreted protein Hcp